MMEWHQLMSIACMGMLKFVSELQPKVQPTVTVVDDPLGIELEWATDEYTATFWFYDNRTYEFTIVYHAEGFQLAQESFNGADVSFDTPVREEFISLLR